MRKTYIIPCVEIIPCMTGTTLDTLSEKTGEAGVINDGELDSNQSSFFDDIEVKGSLWDD